MKKMIVAVLLLLCLHSTGQNARQDASGNYVAIKKELAKGKPTGKYFTDAKGQKYQVFESARGKLYYERTSKTGNTYKVYLRLEGTKP